MNSELMEGHGGAVEINGNPTNVVLPRKLTDENGAKALLVGEFFERRSSECPDCFDDVDTVRCETCEGTGVIITHTMVTWTTIKAIYDKVVEHYGKVE